MTEAHTDFKDNVTGVPVLYCLEAFPGFLPRNPRQERIISNAKRQPMRVGQKRDPPGLYVNLLGRLPSRRGDSRSLTVPGVNSVDVEGDADKRRQTWN